METTNLKKKFWNVIVITIFGFVVAVVILFSFVFV